MFYNQTVVLLTKLQPQHIGEVNYQTNKWSFRNVDSNSISL